MNTKHDTIYAALAEALEDDGVIYLYALPGDEYQTLNPWTDSHYIEATGARLIWTSEVDEIKPAARREAMSNRVARVALALDIVLDCNLYDRAREAMEIGESTHA